METDLGSDGRSSVSRLWGMAYVVRDVVVSADMVDCGIGVLFQVSRSSE